MSAPGSTGASNLKGRRCGSYELIDRIGEGGMGEVWRARSQALGESLAAIKVLHREVNNRPESLARFLQEIAIMGAIAARQDGNVIRAFDTGVLECDGRQYVVMEYCPDGSLEDLLASNGPLPFSLTYMILGQMATALTAAHQNNIIHRDFKPANVLLIRQGMRYSARLTDFGVAKLLGEKLDEAILRTQSLKVLGSCDYMPVEQANPKKGTVADHRIDIYAFGAVLYRCVTGRTPYISKNIVEAIVNVAQRVPFPAPSAIRRDTPPELDAVIMKCLAWDRESRFQSMDEVMMEFTNAIIKAQSLQSSTMPLPHPESNTQFAVASAPTVSETARTIAESRESISEGVGAVVARALHSAVGVSTERRVTEVLINPAGTDGSVGAVVGRALHSAAGNSAGTGGSARLHKDARSRAVSSSLLAVLVGVAGILLGVGGAGLWRLHDEQGSPSATPAAVAASSSAANAKSVHPRTGPAAYVHGEGVVVVRIGSDSVRIDGAAIDETTPMRANVPGGVHKVVLVYDGESLSVNLAVTTEEGR